MPDEYYAARMTNAFIDAVRLGVRDVRNNDLAPFYDGPAVPATEVPSRLEAARAQVPGMSREAFQGQAGVPSQALFLRYTGQAGLESTFEPDIYETVTVSGIPAGGSVTDLLVGEDYGVPVRSPQARSRVANSQLVPETTQHIKVPAITPIADSDSYVRVKADRMRQFVNRLLAPK